MSTMIGVKIDHQQNQHQPSAGIAERVVEFIGVPLNGRQCIYLNKYMADRMPSG
jgi:hypothetical protein